MLKQHSSVFWNHILKWKALDQLQSAGEESLLTCDIMFFFIKIKSNCFFKTYSEIKSMWSINSSKEEIVLSCDSKELFAQHFVSKLKACRGVKSKNKHPSWLYSTMLGPPEAATWGVLLKKLFLKNLQYLQETPVLESFLKKVTDLKASAHNTCCFPVNIAKFLRLPISKNICTQLHFKYLHTVSMVHCYMGLKVQGLDCMAASGFSVFKLF